MFLKNNRSNYSLHNTTIFPSPHVDPLTEIRRGEKPETNGAPVGSPPPRHPPPSHPSGGSPRKPFETDHRLNKRSISRKWTSKFGSAEKASSHVNNAASRLHNTLHAAQATEISLYGKIKQAPPAGGGGGLAKWFKYLFPPKIGAFTTCPSMER